MKTLLLILALAFPLVAQTDELKAKTKTFKNNRRFEVTYDRFKDRTWVKAGPFFLGRANMTTSFTFEGETQRSPIREIMLVLDVRSSTWRFLNDQDLYVILDGERIALGEGDRTGHVTSGYRSVGVAERLIFDIPIEVFEKFTQAKSLEMKVGPVEITLKEEHVIAFRDLLSLAHRS